MTTIATDGKVIAADSQSEADHILQVAHKKLFKINGDIIGACGSVDQINLWLSWYGAGHDPSDFPDLEKDSVACLVLRKSKVIRYDGTAYGHPPGKIAAVGSGGGFAMAAMLAGADPVEAVKIACKLDSGSGGPVKWLAI